MEGGDPPAENGPPNEGGASQVDTQVEAKVTRETTYVSRGQVDELLDKPWNAPLPYDVQFSTIPRITDLSMTWSSGLREIEQQFSMLMKKLEMEFESKTHGLNDIRN